MKRALGEQSFLKEDIPQNPWKVRIWRVGWALCAFLTGYAGWMFVREAQEQGILSTSLRYQLAIATFLSVSCFSLLFCTASFLKVERSLFKFGDLGEQQLMQRRKLSVALLLLMNGLLAYLLVELSGGIFQPYWSRLSGLIVIAFLTLPFVQGAFRIQNPQLAYLLSYLISTLALQIVSLLSGVSAYPFTLAWSEASRYYYASLFLGERLYGIKTAWTVLHPSRYLLQAFPFLLPNSPLWFHRLWQVLLWIGISGLTAYAFLYRFGKRLSNVWWWASLGWLFLYLLLGPVYYHLQLAATPLLFWFDPRARSKVSQGISALVLILCSFWAGLSRINWYPVPALIAILLYLLEVPYGGKFLRYFWRPLVWFLAGLGVAVMTHWGYERLSGNPSAWFGTSLTSQLLWYRLLPNATYPPGILLASWIVILPMGFLLYNRWTHQRLALQPWPWLGILAILLGLYLGGLVVSVKIGGGSNLHNLDAFWMGFGIVFVSLMTQSNGNDNSSLDDLLNRQAWGIFRNEQSMKMALVATLVIPGLFLLLSIQPFVHPNWGAAEKALSSLQNLVSDLPAGREVLFISERQLLTFGYLRGVKLVPEYERVFLMEMAMANNQSYLQQFYRDLRAHRFALIINEPLRTKIKGKPLRFGEENDAWVKRVSKPLLCYYKPLQQDRLFLATLGIQVLEPRPKLPADCTQ